MKNIDLVSLSNLLYPYCFLNCEVVLGTPKVKKPFYIFRVNAYKTVTGFTLYPKNYKDPETSPQEWQIHTVIPKNVYFIDYKTSDNLPEPLNNYQSQFFKVACDLSLGYGDGGHANLKYPLYLCESLPVPSKINDILVRELERIGKLNQDWHTESPVLDIIDPDLAPNYYFKKEREGLSERHKYAWFPVDLTVTPDKDVKLHGPIHNLEMKGNKNLYNCIMQVFKAMIPGFEKLGIVNEIGSTDLQVVIKAQKYVIQPGTSYSGKWHVEGKTENIIASGVYYCKIDEGFENDSVIFRPKVGPDEYYASCKNIETEQEVPIKETSSIIFSNILPHKFLQLINRTSVPLTRLFLNFFIVDPKHKLESTTPRFTSFSILSKLKKFPKALIDEILSYIHYKPTIFRAKELREITRESMKTEFSGWGYIHYGNSGDVEFVDETTPQKKIATYDSIADN